MIKSLAIENFQSHNHARLQFTPGINVIVGTSDSGKSALLRAIGWCVYNRPAGDAHITHGKKTCTVSLELTKTGNVARNRTPTENAYRLGDGLEETILQAVRNDVPAEVQAVTSMGELNLQRQLDAPFLLSLNGPDAARILNEMAGLDNIDGTMSRVAGLIRQNNADLRVAEAEGVRLQGETAKYASLPRLRAVLDGLRGVAMDLRDRDRGITQLDLLLGNIQRVREELADLPAVPDFDHAYSIAAKWTGMELGVQSLSRLLEDITLAKNAILRATQVHQEKVEAFNQQMPDQCPLCGTLIDPMKERI